MTKYLDYETVKKMYDEYHAHKIDLQGIGDALGVGRCGALDVVACFRKFEELQNPETRKARASEWIERHHKEWEEKYGFVMDEIEALEEKYDGSKDAVSALKELKFFMIEDSVAPQEPAPMYSFKNLPEGIIDPYHG